MTSVADLLLAPVVGRLRVGLQQLDQLVAVDALAAARLLLEPLVLEGDRVELLERHPEGLEVPLLGEVLGGGRDVAPR